MPTNKHTFILYKNMDKQLAGRNHNYDFLNLPEKVNHMTELGGVGSNVNGVPVHN